MALVEGNRTTDRRIPAGSSYSFSHNQNVGSDGCLVIIIAAPAVSTSSVTYGGVSMTRKRNQSTPYGTNWTVWELKNPPTGVNTVAVTLSSGSWNGTSTVCYSFTGSDGVGSIGYNGTQTSPSTTSLTISSNSMILGTLIGGNSTSANIQIPQGTSRPVDWNHNINNYTWGGISPSLTSGSKTIQGSSTASSIIMGIEVKELVSILVPTLNTTAISSITSTTASSGGNTINDGGGTITAKGVCWSTSPNPTTANSKTTDGSGTANFTSSITSLSHSTTYYVRAYATNSAGTGYGNQLSFTTATPTITVSPTTLSGFNYIEGSGPSTAQSITYSIADAISDLVVTAPTNYEVSTSEFGTYSSSITHSGPPTGPFTTYVRLKSGLTANTYSGNITLVSSGATTKTVALSGSVTAAPTRRRIIIV